MSSKSPEIPMSPAELVALAVEMRTAQKAYYKCLQTEVTRKQTLFDASRMLEFKFDANAGKESRNPAVAAAITMRTAQKAYYACNWKEVARKKELLNKALKLEAEFDRLARNQPDPQGVFFA